MMSKDDDRLKDSIDELRAAVRLQEQV